MFNNLLIYLLFLSGKRVQIDAFIFMNIEYVIIV